MNFKIGDKIRTVTGKLGEVADINGYEVRFELDDGNRLKVFNPNELDFVKIKNLGNKELLTKREQFALAALRVILTEGNGNMIENVEFAVQYADILIEELAKVKE